MEKLLASYSYSGNFLKSIVSIVNELNVWGLQKHQILPRKNTGLNTTAKAGEITPESKVRTFEKQKRMNASRPTPSGVISSPDPER